MMPTNPPKADFYVAPHGADHWSGTLPEPNAQGTDGPFVSLARARDAIRQIQRPGPVRSILVLIRNGSYRLAETVVFGMADSGSESQTITYAAYPGEAPVFSADAPIEGWRKLKTSPAELPEAARGKVWVADMPETKGGKWRFFTLYDAEGRLPRAQSAGFAPTVGGARSAATREGNDVLHFPPGALRDWPNLEDVEIVIRPHWNWCVNILGLASVDENACVARTTLPGTYPLDKMLHERDNSRTCWVENVLEALDEPGEWVLNTREGRLYLWPRGGAPRGIVAPRLRELIRVEGTIDKEGPADKPVRNLVFRGLCFTHGDRDLWNRDDAGLQHDWAIHDKPNALVRLRGAERCVIEDCHFTTSGGDAVRVDLYGQNNRIAGNHIEQIGGAGILLCGYGPGKKDVNGRNEVFNNHVHHAGQIYWHSPGIFVWQSAENHVANNLIHNMPYNGMVLSGAIPNFFLRANHRELSKTIRWQDVGEPGPRTPKEIKPFIHTRGNVVEKNEVHDVMEMLGDGNGIYVRMCAEGNVVQRNYFHHIAGPSAGQSAMRTDGGQRGTIFRENIIYKCASAGMVLKLDNAAENNLIACLLEENDPENPYHVPLKGYILLREGPMTGARIQRNILYHPGGAVEFIGDSSEGKGKPAGRLREADSDYNLYCCAKEPGSAAKQLDTMKANGTDQHSLAADPMFVDPAHADLRFQPDSPALRLGFVPIDLSEIGLRGAPCLAKEGD